MARVWCELDGEDEARRASRGQPCSAPAVALDPQNTAYLIYTSGSTGTPKGVLGVHYGLVNRIASQTNIAAASSPKKYLLSKNFYRFR